MGACRGLGAEEMRVVAIGAGSAHRRGVRAGGERGLVPPTRQLVAKGR